jgi:hypothetical protein
MIAHWKGIIEEIHFGGSIMPFYIIENLYPKKSSFRPSKWPWKLKLLKIVNCQNCQKTVLSQLEKVGGHQYPPGSFSGYNLREAPTPQFSSYNQKEATTPYVLQLQPKGGYNHLSLPHPTALKYK